MAFSVARPPVPCTHTAPRVATCHGAAEVDGGDRLFISMFPKTYSLLLKTKKLKKKKSKMTDKCFYTFKYTFISQTQSFYSIKF